MDYTPLLNSTNCHEYLAVDVFGYQLRAEKNVPGSGRSNEEGQEYSLPGAYPFINEAAFLGAFWVRLLRACAGVFAFVVVFSFVMLFLAWGLETKNKIMADPIVFLFWLLAPPIVYLVLKFIDENKLISRFDKGQKPFLILRRDLGLVQFKVRGGRYIEVPFDEMQALVQRMPGQNGLIRLYFILKHRYSSLKRCLDTGLTAHTEHEHYVYNLRWELWQQYMDPTRPLPDIPEFEPFRSLDPVSREWDAKHDRPACYWENMDQETYERMRKAAHQAAREYPFSLPEKAESIKWKPAGDGKAWYQLG